MGSITDALAWLTSILIGAIGTSVAIIAVAAIGVAMLQGRVPVRRGAVVVIGCFILFSSRVIAAGLLSTASTVPSYEAPIPVTQPPPYIAPVPPPVPYDPYAGASVPVRPQDGAKDLLPR